jgi:hypothetical protein
VRKLLVAVPFLVVLLVAWPVYVGIQVESGLQEPQTVFFGDLRIHHALDGYQRESYRARASSVLQVTAEGLDLELHFQHRIRHRMLGASVDSQLVEVRDLGGTAFELRDVLVQAQLRAESWMGLGGGVNSRLSSRPLRIALPEPADGPGTGAYLEMAAGQGGLAYSSQRILLSFATGELSLSGAGWSLSLEEPHYGLLIHPAPEGGYGRLPDYDFSLGVERLEIGDGDATMLGIQALRAAAWQNSTVERVDSLLRLRADSVQAGGLGLHALDTHFNALRWHRPTLLRLAEDLARLDSMELERDVRNGMIWGLLRESLPELVGHQPMVKGELRLNEDPGRQLWLLLELSLRGDAALLSTRPLEALALQFEGDLGAQLGLELETLLDAAGVAPAESFRGWLDEAVAEGWLESDEEKMSIRLRMEEGRLLVNEQDRTVLLLALVFAIAGAMF